MSQENVEIVKRVQPTGVDLVELFRASTVQDPSATGIDVTAFESGFEPNFIATRVFGSIEATATFGLQDSLTVGVIGLNRGRATTSRSRDFIDAGDEVVSLTRVRAQTTRDAVAVEHRPAAVWSVREDKIARVRFYLERDEALDAARLEE